MDTEPKPGEKLSPEDFNTIIRLTPLVSIDLVVRSVDGKVWLGRRKHDPAKGNFFVLGGRITKNETLANAFTRLSASEFGVAKRISEARFLGVFEHFYTENRHELAGFGTHYVVLAYELTVSEKLDSTSDEHHESKRWWSEDEILNSTEVHPNTKAYFQTQVLRSESQYKAIADRRNHFNTLLWQTPALSLTAQAFLLNIAANQSASSTARILASIAALFVAGCTLQLFVKHRRQERIAVEVMSAFELSHKQLGYVSISAREHSGTDINFKNWFGRLTERVGEWTTRKLEKYSSFNLWVFLLFMFILMAGILSLLNLITCKWTKEAVSETNAPPVVYSVVTNQVTIPGSFTVRLEAEAQSNLIRAIGAFATNAPPVVISVMTNQVAIPDAVTVKLDTETQSNLVRAIKAEETKPRVPKE